MARDYAKRYNHSQKNTPKKRKKGASRSSMRAVFVIIVILLVVASGVAGYFYYHQPKVPTSLLPLVTDAKATSPKKSVNKAPVVEAKEEPVDYEFYTLLPKINVPDPVQDTTPPEERPGFWLQMAVYYSMRDASAMLDRLQLLGLDPVITERKSTNLVCRHYGAVSHKRSLCRKTTRSQKNRCHELYFSCRTTGNSYYSRTNCLTPFECSGSFCDTRGFVDATPPLLIILFAFDKFIILPIT